MDSKTQATLEVGQQRALLRQIQPLLGRTQMDVLWTLLRFTPQHTRSVQISIPEVAKQIGIGQSTARRAFRTLQDCGLIALEPVIRRNGRQANEYAIMWDEIVSTIEAGQVSEISGNCNDSVRDEGGRWARLDNEIIMSGLAPAEGQRSLFGTEDVGPAEMTDPARSFRPIRPGQNDRSGPVKMTGPTISCLTIKEPITPPPLQPVEPAAAQAAEEVVVVENSFSEKENLDEPHPHEEKALCVSAVRWEVVVEKLHDYGCLSRAKIDEAIAAAKRVGASSERVLGLIDWAARCVVDEPDSLASASGSARTCQRRVYAWQPGYLLYRIANDNVRLSIVEGWAKKSPDYEEALMRQAARQQRRVATEQVTHTTRSKDKTREVMRQTEATWGPVVDAMSDVELQALIGERFPLGSFERKLINSKPDCARSLLIHELHVRPPRVADNAGGNEESHALASVATEATPRDELSGQAVSVKHSAHHAERDGYVAEGSR